MSWVSRRAVRTAIIAGSAAAITSVAAINHVASAAPTESARPSVDLAVSITGSTPAPVPRPAPPDYAAIEFLASFTEHGPDLLADDDELTIRVTVPTGSGASIRRDFTILGPGGGERFCADELGPNTCVVRMTRSSLPDRVFWGIFTIDGVPADGTSVSYSITATDSSDPFGHNNYGMSDVHLFP